MNGPAERVRVAGPSIRLRSTLVQTLSLAIHELATNALKYGALAGERGKLDITWSVRVTEAGERWLELEWLEDIGDRTISASESARIGYGRELIERALPYSLAAKTSYVLDEHGVRCTIALALEKRRPRRAKR